MLTPEWPVGTRVRLRVSLLERCGLEPPCGADEGVIVGVYGMAPPARHVTLVCGRVSAAAGARPSRDPA